MKKIQFITASALTLMMVSTLPSMALAEDVISDKSEANTEGKVSFSVDDEETDPDNPEVVDPTDPDNPGVVDPGDEGSTGDGKKSFKINWVSNFKFGNMLISGKEMTKYAEPTTLNFKPNEDGSERPSKENLPNFVQVTDNRGTNTGWRLTAAASEFTEEDGDSTLKGASLIVTNPQLFSDTENRELAPAPHKKPLNLLDNPGEATTIMTAAKGKGQGTWSMAWSPNAISDNDFEFAYSEQENKGVQLSVPLSATPEADKLYTSTINWLLSDTPNK